jgi:hypothetical protein
MGDHRVGVLVELHPLDHRAVVDSEQSTPYPDTKHPFSSSVSGLQTAPKRKKEAGCGRGWSTQAPTDVRRS